MGCLQSLSTSNGPISAREVSKTKVTFNAKYKKGKQLGKGGYAIVYECTNRTTGQRCAVKEVIKSGMKKDDENALRLEIDILGSLNHPQIVRQYEFFEDWEKFHVVLELLEGGELFDRIVKKTSYNEDEAREIVVIIFKAIKYCHSNGIAHRDLKPENLLLASESNDFDVKLADFGFAKKADGCNLSTQCGSPGYVAPEILNGVKYGIAADMWSLGVITYILLGGYPPFHDDDQKQLFKKIKKGEFEFHPAYWDNISDEAKDLIGRMLTLDVSKRITIDEAMDHAWLKALHSELSSRNLMANLEAFRKFNANRKLKGAVKAVMAIRKIAKLTSPRGSSMDGTGRGDSFTAIQAVSSEVTNNSSNDTAKAKSAMKAFGK